MIRTRNERYLTNPEEVAANRSGTLTDRQRRQAMGLNVGGGALAAFVFVIIGGVVGLAFFSIWGDDGEQWALVAALLVALATGVPAAVLVLIQIARLVFTSQDLSANDVQQADGVVVWRRYRYAAEFPGRAFWTNNSVSGLAPGPYRFFYLPRSGYVLSAEKLSGMMSLGSEAADLNQVLGSVIGFSNADLEANHDGRLGSGQLARMVTAMIVYGVVALVVLIFCGFMAFTVVGDMGTDSVLPLMILGAIGLIGPLVIGWSIIKLGLDLVGGRVQLVEGKVQRTYASSGRSTTYYYLVAGQKFSVSQRAYQALVSGPDYRVYYGPRSKRLLALESKGQ